MNEVPALPRKTRELHNHHMDSTVWRLCCITGRGDSLCESGSIGGRDAEACCPSIPHDELERI